MISLKSYSKPYYIDQTKKLEVLTLPCRSDNYTFLILSPKKNEAILIDCADHKKTLATLKELNLSLKAVFLTHHHFDHVDGLDVILKEHAGAKLYCTQTDQERKVFETKGTWVKEGDQLEVFGEKAEVLFTPGHTTSHVSYYLKESNALFCGDLIFSLGCGRVFEPYKEVYEDFFNSFKKVKNSTNDKTLIFCAHEYTKKNLEFHKSLGLNLKAARADLQQRLARFNNERTVPSSMAFESDHNSFLNAKSAEEFRKVRVLKDNF